MRWAQARAVLLGPICHLPFPTTLVLVHVVVAGDLPILTLYGFIDAIMMIIVIIYITFSPQTLQWPVGSCPSLPSTTLVLRALTTLPPFRPKAGPRLVLLQATLARTMSDLLRERVPVTVLTGFLGSGKTVRVRNLRPV